MESAVAMRHPTLEAWKQDLWKCPMFPGTSVFLSDPSSPVGCQVGHKWIGLVLANSYLDQIGIHWNFRPNHCLELFLMDLGPGCTVHPGALPLGRVIAIEQSIWFAKVFLMVDQPQH